MALRPRHRIVQTGTPRVSSSVVITYKPLGWLTSCQTGSCVAWPDSNLPRNHGPPRAATYLGEHAKTGTGLSAETVVSPKCSVSQAFQTVDVSEQLGWTRDLDATVGGSGPDDSPTSESHVKAPQPRVMFRPGPLLKASLSSLHAFLAHWCPG